MNETSRVAEALAQIPGVALVTRGWPSQTAKLPCLAVTLEDERPADMRDDAVYLTRRSYTVRVFAASAETCDALGDGVTDAMEALGYTLERALEAEGEVAQRRMTFYKLDERGRNT
jgi:hypothetical protein